MANERQNVEKKDVLAHYGVRGMRWGVRRYQNSDGSLTSAGKKRYGSDVKDEPSHEDHNKAYTGKQAKNMSDDELKTAVTRMNLEKQYKEFQPKEPNKLESTKKAVDATTDLLNRAKKIENDTRYSKKERLDLQDKTDKELRDRINRELLERQYNDMFSKPESVSKGRQYVSNLLEYAGPVLAATSSALTIAIAIKELKK